MISAAAILPMAGEEICVTPAVYILADKRNGILYTGVTDDLAQRIDEHRRGLVPELATKPDCKLLVWYQRYQRLEDAISRHKQVDGSPRRKKVALIEALNPPWRDLYEDLT